jgi:hypothetical protein
VSEIGPSLSPGKRSRAAELARAKSELHGPQRGLVRRQRHEHETKLDVRRVEEVHGAASVTAVDEHRAAPRIAGRDDQHDRPAQLEPLLVRLDPAELRRAIRPPLAGQRRPDDRIRQVTNPKRQRHLSRVDVEIDDARPIVTANEPRQQQRAEPLPRPRIHDHDANPLPGAQRGGGRSAATYSGNAARDESA